MKNAQIKPAEIVISDELKAAAKTDLEFNKYFENETFKTITE